MYYFYLMPYKPKYFVDRICPFICKYDKETNKMMIVKNRTGEQGLFDNEAFIESMKIAQKELEERDAITGTTPTKSDKGT